MSFEVRDLTCSFGHGEKEVTIIDHMSFKIEPEEMVAIVGKKRSGKTTLMNVLIGLDKPKSGDIIVDGVKLGTKQRIFGSKLRRNKIGIITREPMLVPELTVYENVMLSLQHQFMSGKVRLKRAKDALRGVGLKGKGKFYPHELTIFEQQKVCAARAMVMNPTYVFADEPTSCLESGDVDKFLDILEVLGSSGCAIVIATYSRRVASRCHRMIPVTGQEIKTTKDTETESSSEMAEVPGHTLAGSRPISSYMVLPEEVKPAAVPSESAAVSEDLNEKEAYERDEIGSIDINGIDDLEFEKKLRENINNYI